MILMNESVISFLIIIFAQTARGSFGNSLGCNCFEYCKKSAANVQEMFLSTRLMSGYYCQLPHSFNFHGDVK